MAFPPRPHTPEALANVLARMRKGRGGAAMWVWGLAIGLVVGYAVIGFRLTIQAAQYVGFGVFSETLGAASAHVGPWRMLLAPIAGGVVAAGLLWLGRRLNFLPETRSLGMADVIEARAVNEGHIDTRAGLYSGLMSALSLGAGASTGREGPAVHLGASLAAWLAERLKLPAADARTLLACGAAAAVAASFNAPIAGAVFALEVVLGHYAVRVMAPVAAAATVGAVVTRVHLGAQPAFAMPLLAPASLLDFPASALLGVIAALTAILFVRGVLDAGRYATKLAEDFGVPLWALPPAAGAMLGVVALAYPEVLGVGYETTARAVAGEFALGALVTLALLKIAATAVSLACRFGGGVFSPSLVIGALVGAAFGTGAEALLGDNTAGVAFYAVVGMGAVSGAALGAPLSTTLIVFEMTASYETAIAVLVAVSLATLMTQRAVGASLFQLQIEQHGYVLREGPQRVILQTVRVRDVMTPIDRLKKESVLEGPSLFEDDTLGKALGFLEAEGIEGAPVKSRAAETPVVGYISRADALIAYNRRLVDAHIEATR